MELNSCQYYSSGYLILFKIYDFYLLKLLSLLYKIDLGLIPYLDFIPSTILDRLTYREIHSLNKAFNQIKRIDDILFEAYNLE